MTGIPLEKAADAFRRFFPEDWRDHLRAWTASRGFAVDPPPPGDRDPLRIRIEVP